MRTRLLLLTDRSQLRLGRGLVSTVRECVDAGLAVVVVREHDLPPPQRSALIRELAGIHGLTVISSRIPDVAADGLHEGASQAKVTERCSWRGRSCHSATEVYDAAAEGVDYVTLSPYAETASKPGYGPALGPAAFASEWPLPVYALGGIDPTNAAEPVEAGAHGVAVMGAVMRAARPAVVVEALLRAVDR